MDEWRKRTEARRMEEEEMRRVWWMYDRIVVAHSMDADVAQLKFSHRGTRNRAWRIVTGCLDERWLKPVFGPGS